MKHGSIIPLVCLAALSACQSTGSKTGGENSAAVTLLQHVNENAQTCWIKSKDRDFNGYAVIPELDTQAGRPRILVVDKDPAGREVRPFDMLEQRAVVDPGVVDERDGGFDQLADVMRGNGCRHSDGDSARAVGEQVRKQARKHLRLLFLAIVGRAELDRVLVEASHQLHRDSGQPRLGVAVGGGVIAVDVAEIPLAVDQRIAKREVLREPDHRVIDRLVAVRVVLADDVADDARRFLVGARRVEPKQPHRPEQAAVDRLQAIADVGQRARRDR